jgi:hypothetical protein
MIEQDHRRVKQRLRPMLGLKSFGTAAVVIGGVELADKIKKGQYKIWKLGGQTALMPEIWQAVLAAYSLQRQESALGDYLRRMKSKLGPAGATTATAHKIAVIFYTMVKQQWNTIPQYGGNGTLNGSNGRRRNCNGRRVKWATA